MQAKKVTRLTKRVRERQTEREREKEWASYSRELRVAERSYSLYNAVGALLLLLLLLLFVCGWRPKFNGVQEPSAATNFSLNEPQQQRQ